MAPLIKRNDMAGI